jgi:hypothetical protein
VSLHLYISLPPQGEGHQHKPQGGLRPAQRASAGFIPAAAFLFLWPARAGKGDEGGGTREEQGLLFPCFSLVSHHWSIFNSGEQSFSFSLAPKMLLERKGLFIPVFIFPLARCVQWGRKGEGSDEQLQGKSKSKGKALPVVPWPRAWSHWLDFFLLFFPPVEQQGGEAQGEWSKAKEGPGFARSVSSHLVFGSFLSSFPVGRLCRSTDTWPASWWPASAASVHHDR